VLSDTNTMESNNNITVGVGRKRSASHGKLKIHGDLNTDELHELLCNAVESKQHGTLSCDEVTFDSRTTALLVEFFRVYNRVWDRMDFEFCDGSQMELVITAALCLESVRRLFVAGEDDTSNQQDVEHLLQTMATMMQVNTSLASLWFLLPISTISSRCLGDMLANAKSLQKLSLSGSQFAEEPAVCEELSRGLRENRTLHTLDLSCCVLDDADIRVLLQSLQHHKRLRNLDISRNRCKAPAIRAVSELLLSDDCDLQRLDLGEQDLEEDEALEIGSLATALGANRKLKTLKLSRNNLKDEQVLELAEALRTNETLSALDLQWNKITDEALKKCSSLLSEMVGLEVLLLGGNSIGKEGVTLLESLPGDDQSICTVEDDARGNDENE